MKRWNAELFEPYELKRKGISKSINWPRFIRYNSHYRDGIQSSMRIHMPPSYKCPYGKGELSHLARGHVKSSHPEAVRRALSQLSLCKIGSLRKHNIDPESWAAGCYYGHDVG